MPNIKYKTEQERIAAKKKQAKKKELKRGKGRYWRLVIPNIEQFGRNPSRDTPQLEALKRTTLELILAHEKKRGLEKWCIAWQTHKSSGFAHLDILLIYSKSIRQRYTWYDYLCKPGHLTRYRSVNNAIIEYGTKEDPVPLMSSNNISTMILQIEAQQNLYGALQRAMRKDPFNFEPTLWLAENDLYRAAYRGNYFKAKKMVREHQTALCHQSLRTKGGIKYIDQALIKSVLTEQEVHTFYSWDGYQTVVDHINMIAKWGFCRPHKTSNLLLVGRPNTGKTTLTRKLSQYVGAYPLGTKGSWFPGYKDQVYKLLKWDEFTLRIYPYDMLLKLLEGQTMSLPVKGGHVPRRDNQLIIMTSNLTLDRIICHKFKTREDILSASANLKPRITQVRIPRKYDLFLLCKIIIGNNTPSE